MSGNSVRLRVAGQRDGLQQKGVEVGAERLEGRVNQTNNDSPV